MSGLDGPTIQEVCKSGLGGPTNQDSLASQTPPYTGKESGKLQLQSLRQWNVVTSSTSVTFQSGFRALAQLNQFPLAASPHSI